MPFVTLAVILLVIGVLLYVLLPYPMATKLLRPPRMTDGKALALLKRLSPADVGLAYEDASFVVRDEQARGSLLLTAWWMPHPHPVDRTAVLIHGYADAKVGVLAWAPLMQSLGYHLLAVDLRGHGGSDARDVTAGYFERHDVSQVIDQLRAARPNQTRQVVLFGVSLGAAVAAALAAMREDLAAAILESPFADYESAVMAHTDLMGMPGPSFVRRAIRRAERVSGADFAQVRPVDLVRQAKCPVMVIAAGGDPLVGPTAASLEQAVASHGRETSVYWSVGGSYHVEGMMSDPEEYRRRVGAFLGAAVGGKSEGRGTDSETITEYSDLKSEIGDGG